MYNEAGWLSEDAHALQEFLQGRPANQHHCDALIVGSGYGGAVAAARLSAAKHPDGRPFEVIVLERGREYLPGMFPSRLGELPGHVRFSQQDGERPRGPATALWDMRLGNDVNVVLGSGLGGGSLINAAVMERPEPEVWQHGWPSGISGERLAPYYEAAADMLGANPLPASISSSKLQGLQDLAAQLPGRPQARRCDVAITFHGPKSGPGGLFDRQPCKQCGDCATGCNWEAKNSLDTNYLVQARQQGARFYCGVLAQRIVYERRGGWSLEWKPTDDQQTWATTAIRCDHLLVCAGSLGSTELLLRSQTEELRFSPALGSRFSTNGDMIVAVADLKRTVNASADERTEPSERHVGPTISGLLRVGEGSRRFAIEEFAVPAPLRLLMAEATASFGALRDLTWPDLSIHWPGSRGADPLAPDDEALDRVMVYGLMGDDGARGRLAQAGQGEAAWDGRLAVQWPDARHHPVFDAQHDAFADVYGWRCRGNFIPNPVWRPLQPRLDELVRGKGVRGPLTTVHPLGGCPMADDPQQGVVDSIGRVFDPEPPLLPGDPRRFHEGLVVLDGAIVPKALGINPALTITALAEHAVPALMRHWKLKPREAPVDPPAPRPLKPRQRWRVPPQRAAGDTTAILIQEKLDGTLTLQGRRYWAELRVDFAPIDDVLSFVRRLPREAGIARARLALYPDRGDRDDDEQWRAERDTWSEPLHTIELSGHAKVLYRRFSGPLGRIVRFCRAAKDPLSGVSLNLGSRLLLGTRAGEQRGLDYVLKVDDAAGAGSPLRRGDRLWGIKTMDCDVRGNPWRQISQMQMFWRPAGGWGARAAAGRLDIDLRYFVRMHAPLVSFLKQPDQATALGELASLALLGVRAMIKTQLLSFIPPVKQERDTQARRPGPLPGLSIERYDLRGEPESVHALLTRYVGTADRVQGTPVLLVHGFTAGGSSFAHPSIQPNLVQHLCRSRREVWVVELRTSIVFDKSEAEDWTFEEVAADLPAIVDFLLEHSEAPHRSKVSIVAHCIGAAMTCYALLTEDSDLYEHVDALVLSQVGPLVQMTAANTLRGYLASYLQAFLGTKTLDARPDFLPGAAESLGQTLLDAVLASLPYPERDLDRAEALRALTEGRPDFRVVRHRADAMLGRLMELTEDSTISDGTLDALDDIFGYARVKTLAQVIQLVRHAMLTDADGRNRQISQDMLRQRLPFPVLLLHGRRSGVFDWRGSLESYEWLRDSHASPGELANARTHRDAAKLHLGLGTPRQLCVHEALGHQDSIIGRQAAQYVFPEIERFLREQAREPSPSPVYGKLAACLPPRDASEPPLAPWRAEMPWAGPWLGWVQLADQQAGQFDATLTLRPSPTHVVTRFVAVVPVRRSGIGQEWQPDLQGLRLWDNLDDQPREPTGSPGKLIRRLMQQPPRLPSQLRWRHRPPPCLPPDPGIGNRMCERAVKLKVKAAEVDGIRAGLLLLTVHDDLPERHRSAGPGWEGGWPLGLRWLNDRRAVDAVTRWFANPPADFEHAILRLPEPAMRAAQAGVIAPSGSLTMAIASCQYPPSLLDNALAQASYRRLAALLDNAPPNKAPQSMLLLGDQVYMDATGGVFDPALDHLALNVVYDRALRLPAFRAVTSRLPTLPMIDDHEVRNGWQGSRAEAVRRQGSAPLPAADRSSEQASDYFDAVSPMHRTPPPASQPNQSATPIPPAAGRRCTPGGWPLYLLDTRRARAHRTPGTWQQDHIVREGDMDSLIAWLLEAHKAAPWAPKFIASPSVLLPLERTSAEPHGIATGRYRSDGWAGYPASRAKLLQAIVTEGIRNVVLLSGDAHMSAAVKWAVEREGEPPLPIYGVMSSSLYAPWRFSNDEPCDYHLQQETTALEMPGGSILKGMTHGIHCTQDAFAVVRVSTAAAGQPATLQVRLHTAGGVLEAEDPLDSETADWQRKTV